MRNQSFILNSFRSNLIPLRPSGIACIKILQKISSSFYNARSFTNSPKSLVQAFWLQFLNSNDFLVTASVQFYFWWAIFQISMVVLYFYSIAFKIIVQSNLICVDRLPRFENAGWKIISWKNKMNKNVCNRVMWLIKTTQQMNGSLNQGSKSWNFFHEFLCTPKLPTRRISCTIKSWFQSES